MSSRLYALLASVLLCSSVAQAQDTVIVQTLTFDSLGRAGYYQFPDLDAGSIEKVIMQYSIRCKNALVSSGSDRNKGCGEWDYSCETYITDSSRVDSLITDQGFSYGPQKFQLMSFVTPYGIGLDLGKNGKMWEFDVSDYVPLLRGWKRLSVEAGGQGQEEMNIRFLFIKGTPSRTVIDLQQLWPSTHDSYQNIQADKRYQPLMVLPRAEGKMFKVRSMITGHGQEGEFIGRNHIITVNGEKFERMVWKQCSENPVYPQGGTWIYARAGWCPGMATDLAEYDVTSLIVPGTENEFDYTVATGSGDSRYVVNNQLVSYGAPNFTRDAAIVEVRRPSDRVEFARYNPASTQPIVAIRNNGSETLTSLTIHYGVAGTPTNTFEWKGSLAFLDTAHIVLPTPSTWGDLDTNVFNVHVAQPNGKADEYAKNDSYSSRFAKAPVYTSGVVIRYKTNNVPEQNWYRITDAQGKTVLENFDAQDPLTTYYDSLTLAPGNYTFSFFDEGENGINFWATPDDGAGTLAFRKSRVNTGAALKTFNPDFGKFVHFDFAIAGGSSVSPSADAYKLIRLFPNPTKNVLNVELKGYEDEHFSYVIINVTGKQVATGVLKNEQIDLTRLSTGSYTLELRGKNGVSHIQFVKE
jgi:hypothetical protein